MLDVFKKAGFTQVKTASVEQKDSDPKIYPDYLITQKQITIPCHPFWIDPMVRKTFEHVYSLKDKNNRVGGIAIRKEIKAIIQYYLNK